MYNLKYYDTRELVSERVYRCLGDRSTLLFNQDLLVVLDKIKLLFIQYSGSNAIVIINTWHSEAMQKLTNNKFKYRGFRESAYNGGAKNSQHRLGNAVDFDVYLRACDGLYVRLKPKIVRGHISKIHKTDGTISLIRRIEDNTNWTHIDFMETGKKELVYFNG